MVHVQPRAGRNQVVGLHDERLKLKISSPPVDGAANRCCRDYLAKLFQVPKGTVLLVSGERSRKKRFLLQGLEMTAAVSRLEELLP